MIKGIMRKHVMQMEVMACVCGCLLLVLFLHLVASNR